MSPAPPQHRVPPWCRLSGAWALAPAEDQTPRVCEALAPALHRLGDGIQGARRDQRVRIPRRHPAERSAGISRCAALPPNPSSSPTRSCPQICCSGARSPWGARSSFAYGCSVAAGAPGAEPSSFRSSSPVTRDLQSLPWVHSVPGAVLVPVGPEPHTLLCRPVLSVLTGRGGGAGAEARREQPGPCPSPPRS